MHLKEVNDKLLLSSYIYYKALDFELNHPRETLKDRVTYFVGCRAYEVLIHFYLKNHLAYQWIVRTGTAVLLYKYIRFYSVQL